jgi:tetratricopeptide (TPR) repeat protein
MNLRVALVVTVMLTGFGGALVNAPIAFAQGVPNTLRSAGVTVAEWNALQEEVGRVAAERGASRAALAAVALRLSETLVRDGRVDVEEVLGLIDDRGARLAELELRLAALERVNDTQISALLAEARLAISAGDLALGDAKLAEAAQSDLASIAEAEAQVATLRRRAAETIARRGDLAWLRSNFAGAGELYEEAAETVSASDIPARWGFRLAQASALIERGDRLGDTGAANEAVRLLTDVVLPLAPIGERPGDWAATQNDLGAALLSLGKRGNNNALEESIEAFELALTDQGLRERHPETWAQLCSNLGNAYRRLAFVEGQRQALLRSIALYRSALTVRSRERNPLGWAETNHNLGLALGMLARQSDNVDSSEAIQAQELALTVWTREGHPRLWAEAQRALGLIFASGQTSAQQRAAIMHLTAALTVVDRSADPIRWAETLHVRGLAHRSLATEMRTQAHPAYLHELDASVADFEAALTALDQTTDSELWVSVQTLLGYAQGDLFLYGERTEALPAAIGAFRSAQTIRTREADPQGWSSLEESVALLMDIARRRSVQSEP